MEHQGSNDIGRHRHRLIASAHREPRPLPAGAVIGRDVRRAFERFKHVAPARFLADVVRVVRLHLRDPAIARKPVRPERLVVTLTTIPQRASRILPTLRSLLDQTCPPDRIILAWPSQSLRTGAPYPAPPCLPGVDVVRCDDIGPATKLLPALRMEPAAALVVIDDDVIYPTDFLETLLDAHRANPQGAFGFRGLRVEPSRDPRSFEHMFATAVSHPIPADILLGTWGFLIPPNAFDDAVHDFSRFPPEVRWVDDVWFSGHLARRGIARWIVPARSFPIETLSSFRDALTDGPNRSGRNDAIAIEAFAEAW